MKLEEIKEIVDEIKSNRIHSRKLKLRDVIMLELRYGLYNGRKHKLREIGNMFGVSRQRVDQIISRAIKTISKWQ